MLVGRRDEVDYIDMLARLVEPGDKAPRLKRVKIVQFTGPPHSGKTELLKALAGRYGRVVPVGWHDFAHDRQDLRNDEVLNALAFLLSAPRGDFGQLAFPRLLSTLIAMKQDLGNSRHDAVRNITRALEDPDSVERTTKIVAALADDATGLVEHLLPPGEKIPGTATISAIGPDIVLGAMRRTGWGRRRLSPLAKSGLGKWPGMTTPDSVYQTLADINFNRNSPDPRLRELGESQPWGAFLADIRDSYDRSGASLRNQCTLLILDNADWPGGRQFIRGLAAACARRRQDLGHNDAAPLLVVAAGRQAVTWADLPWDIEVRALPDLAFPDVSALSVQLNVPATAAAEGAVHEFSAGHKGIAEDLLAYCKSQPTYPYDLAPGVDMRRRLLPDVGEADFAALVTCAPAVDVVQVEKIIRDAEEGGADPAQLPGFGLRGILGDLGWLSGSMIHPGIRNLLLRELARRPEGHQWPWSRACGRLREHPPAQVEGLTSDHARQAVNRAYYNLAAGNIADAMRTLVSIPTDASDWLVAFDWIISAPHPYDVCGQPLLLAARLANAANLELADTAIRDELTKLVVACWLTVGCQLDPWHELDQVIARGYEAVAPLVGGDEFYRRAERHRDTARWWRHSGQSAHPRPGQPGLTRLDLPTLSVTTGAPVPPGRAIPDPAPPSQYALTGDESS
jgi:hypothetical protein